MKGKYTGVVGASGVVGYRGEGVPKAVKGYTRPSESA